MCGPPAFIFFRLGCQSKPACCLLVRRSNRSEAAGRLFGEHAKVALARGMARRRLLGLPKTLGGRFPAPEFCLDITPEKLKDGIAGELVNQR